MDTLTSNDIYNLKKYILNDSMRGQKTTILDKTLQKNLEIKQKRFFCEMF